MDASEARPAGTPPVQESESPRGYGRRFTFSAEPRAVRVAPSQWVRSLKLILPATAVVVITLLVAWPQLHDGGTDADRVTVRSEDAEDVRMRNARYVGTDSSNRPFTVMAEATRQVGADTQQLSLEKPQADITLADGSWVAATADRGLFDRGANRLSLSGDVQLFHDQGYQVRTDSAEVDLTAAVARGDRPVVAQGPAGTVTGEGFRIEENGNRVILTGRAHLEFRPRAFEKQVSRTKQ